MIYLIYLSDDIDHDLSDVSNDLEHDLSYLSNDLEHDLSDLSDDLDRDLSDLSVQPLQHYQGNLLFFGYIVFFLVVAVAAAVLPLSSHSSLSSM